MSERPIRVGDLVVYIRDCCGAYLGKIFKVTALADTGRRSVCESCGAVTAKIGEIRALGRTYNSATPLHWLKRIPPLPELEGQRTEESLRTPTKEPA